MVRVPCLQSGGRFGGWPAAARPSKKGRSEVVPECFRVEVGWDSLLRLRSPGAREVPRLYVPSALPSACWLRGARTGPGRQVRLRLRSTLFATDSAPLPPRPVTSWSPTFFRRQGDLRAPSKSRVVFSFFWEAQGGAGSSTGRNLRRTAHSPRPACLGRERLRREGRFGLVSRFCFCFFFF